MNRDSGTEDEDHLISHHSSMKTRQGGSTYCDNSYFILSLVQDTAYFKFTYILFVS